MKNHFVICALASTIFFNADPVFSKDIIVMMKTRGPAGLMVFEPAYVAASVGDKVHFMPTDPGHNAQPISDMLPEGISAPAGQMNKEYVLTLTKPGLYGIKCQPHYSMGMVALVKAGKGVAPNAAAARAAVLPALAAKRMAPLFAQTK